MIPQKSCLDYGWDPNFGSGSSNSITTNSTNISSDKNDFVGKISSSSSYSKKISSSRGSYIIRRINMTTTSSELSNHLNNINNITISMKILGSSNSGSGNDENKSVHGKKKKKKKSTGGREQPWEPDGLGQTTLKKRGYETTEKQPTKKNGKFTAVLYIS